ncbi:MAG: DUF5050 domain-containing protein [Clostridiales bacterium]|nr:DUF5050 domain-containing protein [Clostridiales bacterium]
MNSKSKRNMFLITIVTIAIIVFFVTKLSNKTIYNEEDTIGNTAGNLYNGGLFCERGNYIYFSNFEDDGAIYRMDSDCTNLKKISTDKACFINADENYLYYSRINYIKENPTQTIFTFYNRGIYRTNHNGDKLLLLYKDPSGLLSLHGNEIYYQHYNKQTGTKFYQVGIDGKKEKEISDDAILPASYYNGTLYYAGVNKDHFIHAMDLKTKSDTIFYAGNCYMPIATEKGIYYISLSDNYALAFLDYSSKEPVILTDQFCSSFNISADGNTIYYQVDGGDHNGIYKLDLATGASEIIINGNYKNIHVTSKYIFFRDFDETHTYAYEPTSGNLEVFSPSETE